MPVAAADAPPPSSNPAAPAPAAPAPPPIPGLPPDQYQVSVLPANIASTVAVAPHDKVQVSGQPSVVQGHPCTLWDSDDIAHYKAMLTTSKELQFQFAAMQARMDKRIATPINIPPPQKAPDGTWLFPGDYYPPLPDFPKDDPERKFYHYLGQDSDDMSDLGILYALTGDQKYADYAKQGLLAYAHASQFSASKMLNYKYAQGMSGQLLDEALMLDHLAFSYDLIYNLPSWTPAERTQIHDELLQPFANEMIYPANTEHDPDGAFFSQINNRGVIGATSVLWAGYVTGDQDLINAALYGVHGTLAHSDIKRYKVFPPPHDWTVSTKEAPTRGLLTVGFTTRCIPGGMWVEGTPSYAFYVLGSMIDAAEMGWHHGLDLYRYNDCIFKYMFDFPLLLSYPDFTTPGENDSHREILLGGSAPGLYDYAYRRYQDPRYLAVINNPDERAYLANPTPPPGPNPPGTPPPAPGAPPPPASDRHLTLTRIGSIPPSVLYDLSPSGEYTPPSQPSVNYTLVGFGILRTPAADGNGTQNLILSYGPSASHGHPDKLHIDLYALNDVLLPSPGIDFPYAGNIRIPKWYHTTLGHNTLTVDEKSQDYHEPNPKQPDVTADQLVYAPSDTVGLERAWTNSAYPGVTMDRAVFLTTHYLADLFGAFSTAPHQYDLAWHIRGDLTTDLALAPMPFPEPVQPGYNQLTNVRAATAGVNPWSVTTSVNGHTAHLLVAAGPATQAIVGDGGFYADRTPEGFRLDVHARPPVPTLIERRANIQSTLYGNALDLSDAKGGYIKSVAQEGGLDTGYGLLKVTTVNGTDLCFAAYRPGTYKAGGLQTDALQAFVQMNGQALETLYLGGGKTLSIGEASITRSEPGLAYVEKAPDGGYFVGNPSPAATTVTVTLPALAGLEAFTLDDQGQHTGPATVTHASGNTLSLHLDAGAKVEFAPKNTAAN
jgi:hypothetical protein